VRDLKVVKIEKALLKKLYEEPDLQGKMVLWKEIGRRAKMIAKPLPAVAVGADGSTHHQGR
jgi:hypothetical protein